jgi:hypothetical protein
VLTFCYALICAFFLHESTRELIYSLRRPFCQLRFHVLHDASGVVSWGLEEQQQMENVACYSSRFNLIKRRRSPVEAIFFFFVSPFFYRTSVRDTKLRLFPPESFSLTAKRRINRHCVLNSYLEALHLL